MIAEQRESLIPPAGAMRSRDEWRLWKLKTWPDGHVQEIFMARGASREEALEVGAETSGGFLPACWKLQRVYVCEVFGPAEEISLD